MKKIHFVQFMALVIISCSEVPLDDNNELQPVCSHINNVLTIEEALEQLYDLNLRYIKY